MKLLKNDICHFSYIEYEKQYFSPRRYVADSYDKLNKNYIAREKEAYGLLIKETDCFYTFYLTDKKGRYLHYNNGELCSLKVKKENVSILGIARKYANSNEYQVIYGG